MEALSKTSHRRLPGIPLHRRGLRPGPGRGRLRGLRREAWERSLILHADLAGKASLLASLRPEIIMTSEFLKPRFQSPISHAWHAYSTSDQTGRCPSSTPQSKERTKTEEIQHDSANFWAQNFEVHGNLVGSSSRAVCHIVCQGARLCRP